MKYRPQFPASFTGIDDARAFCVDFFAWHNRDQRHSGIGFHTPASVYYGTANEVRRQRAVTLDTAYAAHPERFVAGPPRPPESPKPCTSTHPRRPSAPTSSRTSRSHQG